MSEMLELRHISKTFGAGTINEKKAVEDPVSYTHLDVYKRQSRACLWR